MRGFVKMLAVLIWVMLVPTWAYAQASITGVVKDSSGAVLPGVTVEAMSPALIEKVRAAVTDGTGQYRIVDLRPGTYTVTFTLTGFSTLKREGIGLEGSFAATVNAELRVGSLAETITVTGESPTVDLQSAKRQQVFDSNVLTAVPAARASNGFLNLVPGITQANQDVVVAPGGTPTYGIHGGRDNEGRIQVDGTDEGASRNGGGTGGYVADIGNAQEVVFSTSGGLAEAEVGGAYMNVIPRTGGNTIKGSFFANGMNEALQGSNYTQALKDAGLTVPAVLLKQWDIDGAIGGPIRKDRLWYFANARSIMLDQSVPGMYANLNAGDPAAWTYVPDRTRQARTDSSRQATSLRLTWQVTPRNKVGGFWDEQPACAGSGWTANDNACRQPTPGWIFGGSATLSPEAGMYSAQPQRVQQASWTSPITNRFLAEASFGTYLVGWGGDERPGNVTRPLVRVTEQAGSIPGLVYRSQDWAYNWIGAYRWRGSVSYITGAHNLKVGYQGAFFKDDENRFINANDQRLSYRFNNGVPNQLTMSATGYLAKFRTRYTSVYAQEQWTRGRLTLQGGIRYDHPWSYFPAQQVGPERFIPVPIAFPETTGVKGFNDLTPRMGAVYDLFGNGKTSIKVNLGKYLEAAANVSTAGAGVAYSGTNPLSRIATTTSRSWTDANRNFVPDCDLRNPLALDNRAAGGDFCGAFANQSFGTANYTTGLDPALLEGWGVRPWDWGFGASVQHEVLSRVSVEIGYYRRWFGNFIATDNRAVAASDFTRYSITAPADSRLPSGGGYTISGLYDVNPLLFGRVDNFITAAGTFGNQTQYWHGVDVNVNARLRGGLTVQGGTSTGQTVTDNCDIRAQLPEIAPVNLYCHVAAGFLTQVKGLGSYTIPKVDVQVSATFQSKPGVQLSALYDVPNAIVQQTLGRSLSGGAANVTVDLLTPGQRFGDRINEVDLRVAKVLRFGRTRTTIGVDLYNALNSAAVLTYNQTYNPTSSTWLTPTSVLTARFAKFSAQIDF